MQHIFILATHTHIGGVRMEPLIHSSRLSSEIQFIHFFHYVLLFMLVFVEEETGDVEREQVIRLKTQSWITRELIQYFEPHAQF